MNFLRHIFFGTLAVIVTLFIYTVAFITYLLLSPLLAATKTAECWKESLFNVKRRQMESKR